MKALASWAKRRGLDVSGKRRWSVWLRLRTKGARPAKGDFSFTIWEEPDEPRWQLRFEYRMRRGGPLQQAYFYKCDGQGVDWDLSVLRPTNAKWTGPKLRPPKSIEDVPSWLARVEKTLDIRFRRDRPRVESSLKGGTAAIAAWIA
jgi:hypothetical protein